MTDLAKAIAIPLVLAITALPVFGQERQPAPKPGLAAHCAGLVTPARDAELRSLPTLPEERVRKVLSRHARATVRGNDMAAVLACLKGAVSAAK